MLSRSLAPSALALAVTALSAASCATGDAEGAVLVEVQTDFVPGREFRSVRVALARDARPDVEIASEARDAAGGAAEEEAFRRGLRVAELGSLGVGTYRVTVELRDAFGGEVGRRMVRLDVGSTSRGLRVVVSRACVGVSCPGAGPAELSECEGGRCVDPRCGSNGGERCPVATCTGDTDCAAVTSCATGACAESGSCLFFGDSSECAATEWCHPDEGCSEITEPAMDGGVDAGADAGPAWDPDTDPALVAWFRLDENAAPYADSSPSGTLSARCQGGTSCPASLADRGGRVVRFDGTDDRLTVAYAPALATPTGLTVAVWFTLAAVPVSPIQSIVAKPFGGTFRNSWQLALIDTDGDGEGEIAFAMDEASSEATAPHEVTVAASTWIHAAGVWDGDTMRLYVDGVQRGDPVNLPAPLFDSSDVLIGADATGPTALDFFEGRVDDVRVYARALTGVEIARLFDATRAP